MHRCCQMNKDLTSQQSICLDYSNIFRPKTTVFVTTKARLMHVAVAATIGGRFTLVCMVAGMVGILFGLSSNLSYNFCTGQRPWRLAEYRKKKGSNSYMDEIDYLFTSMYRSYSTFIHHENKHFSSLCKPVV